MEKLELKIEPKKLAAYIKFFVVIGAFALLGYVGYFLYKNFYQVLTESEEIVKLQKSITDETINMVGFNKTIEQIAEKKVRKNINGINNPFD